MSKKVIIALVIIILLSLIGYSYYIFNLEKYINDQDTLLYGQSNLVAGSKASLRIVALNHKNSEPISYAVIEVKSRNKDTRQETVLFEGKTNELGSTDVSFVVPEDIKSDYELVLTTSSKYGKDEIIKTVKVKQSFKILLTTDKPLYQPGQTIHIRALALRDYDSIPAKGQKITIEVEDSKANKIFKKKLQASDYGIVGTNFTLASEINYGRYTVRAVIDDYSTEKKIEVKKYVLPKFKIDFSTDKTYYLPKQKLIGTINTNYFFGKPTNDAEVNVKIYTYKINTELIGGINGITDQNGIFRFEYDLPSNFIGLPLEKGSGLVFFNISVSDQSKHREEIVTSVPIAKEPIEIELIPESGELEKGLENIIYVITTYPDGKPAPSTVIIKGQQIQTNSYGIGEFKIIPDNFFVEIQATAQDKQGNTGTAYIQFPRDYVKSPRTEDEYRRNQRYYYDRYRTESVLLRVDKSIFDVGETVHLNLFYTGNKGTVYVDVIKNKQTILTKSLEVLNGKAALDIDLDESMTGTLELHAYKIMRNSDIVRDSRTVFVNQRRDVNLDIQPDKNSYLPGEESQISFHTTKGNNDIPTAIGVNIVDESVFALQEKESGFERLYFELEKELMTPRYMIYGITLPELIYEEKTLMDDTVRAQASNILMAGASSQDRFSLKVSSQQEKHEKIEQKKNRYFGSLFKISNIFLILIPLTLLGLTIFGHRNDKKNLLKDFGLSLPLLIGIMVFIASLFWSTVIITQSFSYNQRDFVSGVLLFILIIGLIITVILSIWSARRDYFKIYFVSMLLIPVELLLVVMEIINYTHAEIMIFLIPIIILLVIIVSLVLLIRYSKGNDVSLLWICLLYLTYVVLLPLFIFAGAISDLLENMKLLIWIGITALIIPIVYAIYSIDFMRLRNKLAVPALFMALLLFIVPFTTIAYFGVLSPSRFMATMDITEMADSRVFEKQARREETSLQSDTAEQVDKPRVRQFFPETLYSNPQIITDQNGHASINLQVADSITTWRITALANSLNGDIGSNNEGLLVFQDFFVDIDLPVSLTQGDEISIPISIFNYLKTSQTVRLELQTDEWFELQDEQSKTLTINANDIDVIYFRIKAKKLGNNKLTIFAYGTQKSDAISRIIEIVPDGKEFRTSYSDKLIGDVDKLITVPESAIEDSEKLFVKIYPGIFSQVVEGLDSMLRMPNGCFEQTSSITYPNVLVMDYMKSTNQITPEIQFKAENYIATGYQRLMTFEATSGGFSIFGKQPAEKIVTAYGLLEFADMSKVYEIDEGLIPRVQDWLLSQIQNDHWTPDGSYGAAYKARNSDIAATCYITWSLLNSGVPSTNEKIQKALNYIEKNYITENDNPYALGLCGLALSKGKKNARLVLGRLDELAKKDDKVVYWTSKFDSHGYESGSDKITPQEQADVETTAVVALAYLEEKYNPNDINKVLQFLVNKKDSYGTWGSTQATVLAMKALLTSIRKAKEKTDATITVFVNNQNIKQIKVNNDNNDVLHLIDLKDYAKKGNTNIKIQIEGEGNLFYQIVSSYYLNWKDNIVLRELGIPPLIDIQLSYDKTKLRTEDIVTANVNVKYNGVGVVNYAIVDLGIPPGFSVVSEDFTNAKQKGLIEKYDITGRQIILYLQNLNQDGIQLNYRLLAKYPIKGKTLKSSVYDYYNPDLRDETEPIEINVV